MIYLNKSEDEPELLKELPDIWTGKGGHEQLEEEQMVEGERGTQFNFPGSATKITVKNWWKKN